MNVAVLLSGQGRTLTNLVKRVQDGLLPVKITMVITDNYSCRGFANACNYKVICHAVNKNDSCFNDRVFYRCRENKIDLICLAGFLSKLTIPEDYKNKVMNIHPSLLPAFGGKGFYGSKVHKSVLETGVKISGCTVHFCDNEYDTGPIIAQATVPVFPDDNVEKLSERVFEEEKLLYPACIKAFAEDKIKIAGRIVCLL